MQTRLQILVRKKCSRRFSERLGKRGEILFPHRQAGRHFVATEFLQPRFTMSERFDKRETLNAAPTPLSQGGGVESHDDRRPMVSSRQSGSDNSENAGMPVARPHHNGGVAIRIDRPPQLFFGFAANSLLNALPFPILLIEQRCQDGGFRLILGQQELQSLFRGGETSGRIEPRPKTERDIFGGNGRTHRGHLHELSDPWAPGPRNFHDAALHEDAVLILQRNNVRYRSKRYQVEFCFQVEPRRWPRFEQGMTKLKSEADTAKIREAAPGHGFRVHQRHAIGQGGFWFVMIEHDDIDSPLFQAGDLVDRGGPTIDREQKLRTMLLATPVDALRTQAVAFLHPQRQEQFRGRPIAAQHFREQRERSDAVHIVIAEKYDALPVINRAQDPGHRGAHVRQEKWVAQGTEAWLEKGVHLFGICEAFSLQQLGDTRQAANLRPGNGGLRPLFRAGNDPTFLHKSDYLRGGSVARRGSFHFAPAFEPQKRIVTRPASSRAAEFRAFRKASETSRGLLFLATPNDTPDTHGNSSRRTAG